ncbi:hypothetical protein EFP84_16160 [Leptospira kmetyi]|uniref:Uncharacterized protein n=1 Tax=Leptospira kmetyi TaxID=408139 RepID=A0AAD0USX3_9LEPT|nr:hypothetical protein EFP84_16160 [Leptospira kmetyi]
MEAPKNDSGVFCPELDKRDNGAGVPTNKKGAFPQGAFFKNGTFRCPFRTSINPNGNWSSEIFESLP